MEELAQSFHIGPERVQFVLCPLIYCLGLVGLEAGVKVRWVPACIDHVQVVVMGVVQRDYRRSMRIYLCLYSGVIISFSSEKGGQRKL